VNRAAHPAARPISSGAESIMNAVVRFARNESGSVAIEYALIASIISIAIILSAKALGEQLNAIFTGIVANFG
jgi:Flp pilus assembly pilin Flp